MWKGQAEIFQLNFPIRSISDQKNSNSIELHDYAIANPNHIEHFPVKKQANLIMFFSNENSIIIPIHHHYFYLLFYYFLCSHQRQTKTRIKTPKIHSTHQFPLEHVKKLCKSTTAWFISGCADFSFQHFASIIGIRSKTIFNFA